MSFNTMRKAKLAMAVSAVLAGGIGTTNVGAVSQAIDGRGDAALFQYYTANNGWQTFFRIINTSPNTVFVKIRFREAENSRDALDWGVFLSPFDMSVFWTDANADGQGNPGVISEDTSCTVPHATTASGQLANETWVSAPLPGQPGRKYALFKSRAYSNGDQGDYGDGGDAGIGRAISGHVEAIAVAQWPPGTPVSELATHSDLLSIVDSHIPPSPLGCQQLDTAFSPDSPNPFPITYLAGAFDAGNVLAANAWLFRGQTGFGAGYDPVILADFSTRPVAPFAQPLVQGAPAVTALGTVPSILQGAITDHQLPDLDSGGEPLVGFGAVGGVFQTPAGISRQLVNGAELGPVPLPIMTYLVDGFNGESPFQLPRPTQMRVRSDAAFFDPVVGATGAPLIGSVDAVSALLMRDRVINEWQNRETPDEVVTHVHTEWVLTFPTKNFYVDMFADLNAGDDIYPALGTRPANAVTNLGNTQVTTAPGANAAYPPFTNSYNGGSCERFFMDVWGREEEHVSFTSPEPPLPGNLCNETNVIVFGQRADANTLLPTGSAARSAKNAPIEIPDLILPGAWNPDKRGGWAQLQFTGAKSRPQGGRINGLVGSGVFGVPPVLGPVLASPAPLLTGNTYYGLPVMGFQLTNFTAANPQANLTAIHNHKYIRNVSTSPVPSTKLSVAATTGATKGVVSSSNTAGINCGSDCSEVYAQGQVVTLLATPTAVGASFGGWVTGGCPATNVLASNCSVPASTQCTVTIGSPACVIGYSFVP